jgi:hypothetical protein
MREASHWQLALFCEGFQPNASHLGVDFRRRNGGADFCEPDFRTTKEPALIITIRITHN